MVAEREVRGRRSRRSFSSGSGWVASEQKFATVSGWDAHIDHLQGGKFLRRAANGEARSEVLQLSPERDVQAVREVGDEHVRLDVFDFF